MGHGVAGLTDRDVAAIAEDDQVMALAVFVAADHARVIRRLDVRSIVMQALAVARLNIVRSATAIRARRWLHGFGAHARVSRAWGWPSHANSHHYSLWAPVGPAGDHPYEYHSQLL